MKYKPRAEGCQESRRCSAYKLYKCLLLRYLFFWSGANVPSSRSLDSRLSLLSVMMVEKQSSTKPVVFSKHCPKTVKGDNFPKSRSTSLSFCQFKKWQWRYKINEVVSVRGREEGLAKHWLQESNWMAHRRNRHFRPPCFTSRLKTGTASWWSHRSCKLHCVSRKRLYRNVGRAKAHRSEWFLNHSKPKLLLFHVMCTYWPRLKTTDRKASASFRNIISCRPKTDRRFRQ